MAKDLHKELKLCSEVLPFNLNQNWIKITSLILIGPELGYCLIQSEALI